MLDARRRFKRFEEGLQIITHLLARDAPLTFDGEFYRVKDAVLLPRPHRHIPILIGGNGEKRTLPFAARYASEWNATFQSPENFARLNAHLDELLAANGRQPREVRRSMMTGCIFGKDDAEVQLKASAHRESIADLRKHGRVVGTASEMVDQLGRLAEAGVQRVMLQWLDLDDLAGLEALARDVLPQFKT